MGCYLFLCFLETRLACSQDPEMVAFFVNSETQLFKYRFSCFNQKEILSSIRILKKFQNLLVHSRGTALSNEAKQLAQVLASITSYYSWERLVSFYVNGSSEHFMLVPFQYVPDFVATRSVVLKEGSAYVPCSRLCDLMAHLFESILQHGMILAQTKWRAVFTDHRMERLFTNMRVGVGCFTDWCTCHHLHYHFK